MASCDRGTYPVCTTTKPWVCALQHNQAPHQAVSYPDPEVVLIFRPMFRILLCLLILSSLQLFAQQDFDVDQSVKMTASVDASGPSITVNWVQDPRAISYDLYRRAYGDNSWGIKLASYPAATTQYVDTDVELRQLYEYKIEKFTADVEGYGYVLSGIALPPVHEAGRLIIVTTPATAETLHEALTAYRDVLASSGWPSRLITVSPSAAPAELKAAILEENADFSASALLLFGEVPIAFSGDINPDAHDDHKGAWPADLYYGDLDGEWTDTLVDNTTAATTVNHNVPGDGKWDQSFIPSDIELAVGRVDFSGLTVFSESPEELLEAYLQKNIAYRTRALTIPQRAAMRNSNPWIGALGQNGIRNFSPLVSPENITYGIWQNVFQDAYLWYYGAGSDAVRNGLSSSFANGDFQAVFTLWFSSYVGDYGLTDNYMAAALGSGNTLTAGWAGAPHWHLHSMAMGYPLAHGLVTTQNNDTIYTADFFPRGTHVNLLGDPTLTAFVVPPPSALTATEIPGAVELRWVSTDPSITRHYIYRKKGDEAFYQLLDSTLADTQSYLDQTGIPGTSYDYLVRAGSLTTSPSGSFWNLSTGATAGILLSTSTTPTSTDESITVYPNPTSGHLNISSTKSIQRVSISSLAGVTLRRISANANRVEMALSSLPAGTYLVHISSTGEHSTHRITIVR